MLLQGENLLMSACREKQLEDLQRYIRLGYDVNSKGSRGLTPLMYAAISNFAQGIKLLIENDALIEQTDAIGFTALKYAEQNNSDEVLVILKSEEVVGIQLSQEGRLSQLNAENEVAASSNSIQTYRLDYTNEAQRVVQDRYTTEYASNFRRIVSENTQRLADINEQSLNHLSVQTYRGHQVSGLTYRQMFMQNLENQRLHDQIEHDIERSVDETSFLGQDDRSQQAQSLQDNVSLRGSSNLQWENLRNISSDSQPNSIHTLNQQRYANRRATFPEIAARAVARDNARHAASFISNPYTTTRHIHNTRTSNIHLRNIQAQDSENSQNTGEADRVQRRTTQGVRQRPQWNTSTTASYSSGPAVRQRTIKLPYQRVRRLQRLQNIGAGQRENSGSESVTVPVISYDSEGNTSSQNSVQDDGGINERAVFSNERGVDVVNVGSADQLSESDRLRRPSATPFPQIQQIQFYDTNDRQGERSADNDSVVQIGNATSTNQGGGSWFISSNQIEQRQSRISLRGCQTTGQQRPVSSISSRNRSQHSELNNNSNDVNNDNNGTNNHNNSNNNIHRTTYSSTINSGNQINTSTPSNTQASHPFNVINETMQNNQEHLARDFGLVNDGDTNNQGSSATSNNNTNTCNRMDNVNNTSSNQDIRGNNIEDVDNIRIRFEQMCYNLQGLLQNQIDRLGDVREERSLRIRENIVRLQNQDSNLDNDGVVSQDTTHLDICVQTRGNGVVQAIQVGEPQIHRDPQHNRNSTGVNEGTDTNELSSNILNRNAYVQATVPSIDVSTQVYTTCQSVSIQTDMQVCNSGTQMDRLQQSQESLMQNRESKYSQTDFEQDHQQEESLNACQFDIQIALQQSLEDTYVQKRVQYDLQIAEQMQASLYSQGLESNL